MPVDLLILLLSVPTNGQLFLIVAGCLTCLAAASFLVMSAFAQLDRDQLAERTNAGMAAAAEHGRKAGRREVSAAHADVKRVRDLKAQGLTTADIKKILGASRATVYRYLNIESNELT